jgi:putative transposase
MTAFIDEHRAVYGVEPICKVLPIAPSTYYLQAARKADPELRPDRAWRDDALCAEIQRVWDENKQVYGVRKVWKQLLREGFEVARCTVARLMRRMGLVGVVRGKVVKTTHSGKATPCPRDQVNRQFKADRPNALWVSDFTYVSTWAGFVYVAFVIDVFARRIVGWKVSSSARTDFVLDALEQALHARLTYRPGRSGLPQSANSLRKRCQAGTRSALPPVLAPARDAAGFRDRGPRHIVRVMPASDLTAQMPEGNGLHRLRLGDGLNRPGNPGDSLA